MNQLKDYLTRLSVEQLELFLEHINVINDELYGELTCLN